MTKTQHVCLDEVIGYFDALEDPRSAVNQKHPLVSVVVLAMMAVLAGAGGPTAIARWAACKGEFLSKVLSLRNRPLCYGITVSIVDSGSRLCNPWHA